jgi:hypothetical protein
MIRPNEYLVRFPLWLGLEESRVSLIKAVAAFIAKDGI